MARRHDTPERLASVTAAATRIKLRQTDAGATLPRRQEWQVEALAFAKDVPEIGFASRFVKNQAGKLRLYVGYRPDGADPNESPMAVDADDSEVPDKVRAAAIAELNRLKSGRPTMSALLGRFASLLDLNGECYLVGYEATATTPETWTICSRSEVVAEGGKIRVRAMPGDPGREITTNDTVIRLYVEDDEWHGLAASPMQYLLTDCRTLQVLTQQIWAESSSRLSAGFVLIPSEGSPMPVDKTGDDPADDPLMDAIIDTTTSPMVDPSSAASVVPTLIRFPAEWIHLIRHLSIGREPDDQLDNRINQRIQRIARGLDLPVEVVMGHAETTFSNAAQIDQDTFEDHLDARCVTMVELLTMGFLTPQLLSYDDPVIVEWAARLELWYDPAALIAQPDTEKNADSGHDRGALSDDAWRRAKGFDADDAPTMLERIMRILAAKGTFDPTLTNALLRYAVQVAMSDAASEDQLDLLQLPIVPAPVSEDMVLPPLDDDEVIVVQTAGEIDPNAPPPSAPPSAPPPAAPMSASGGPPGNRSEVTATATVASNPLGGHLQRIDRDLRLKVQTAASAALDRTLERAGNRIKSKAGTLRAACQDIAPRFRAAHIGRPALTAAGVDIADLVAGEYTEFVTQYRTMVAAAQSEALDDVARHARFTSTLRTHLASQQVQSLDASAGWLERNLTAFTEARMFDPTVGLLDQGEADLALSVPAGLIRHALALAGRRPDGALTADAVVVTTTGLDAWVVLPSDAGGVSSGDLLMDAFEDAGGQIEAYQWVWGGAARAFEPHVELDGETFEGFEDDILVNGGSFPDSGFYFPGDHAGCTCDFIPIMIDPPEGATATTAPTGGDLTAPDTEQPAEEPPAASARETADEAADRLGVDVDELRAWAKSLDGVKADLFRDAAQTQVDAYRILDSAEALRIQLPPKGTKLGGEWDWYKNLSRAEQKRLSRRWIDRYVEGVSGTANSLDNVADRLRAVIPGARNLTDDQVITQHWLPQTRVIEAAGAVRQGKFPSWSGYGGALDLVDLVPNTRAAGYDPYALLTGNRWDQAKEVARVARHEVANEAQRALGQAVYAIHGSPPWQMGYLSWSAEVQDLEYLAQSTEVMSSVQSARLAELVPADLDAAGLTYEALYARIIETARLAEEDIADYAIIPWS